MIICHAIFLYNKLLLFFFFEDNDYVQLLNLPITFGPDEFERRVTIQTNPDSVVEGTEEFTVQLVSVSDRVVLTENTADISIQETENGKSIIQLFNRLKAHFFS